MSSSETPSALPQNDSTLTSPQHEVANDAFAQYQKEQPHHFGQSPNVSSTSNEIQLLCGPLLNYKHMTSSADGSPTWHGTVLVVTTPGQKEPSLQLQCLGAVNQPQTNGHVEHEQGIPEAKSSPETETRTFSPEKLYEDPKGAFWRFSIDLPFLASEAQWKYHIPNLKNASGADAARISTRTFHVPAANESMRIMFHSCNGFSVGTDEEAWSGCALWNDVLRKHEKRPIHVMIGGGDQIYCDGIRVDGPLRPWCDISNPLKRKDHHFDEKLRADCDEYYFNAYCKWYSTEPFSTANGIIPQINIWDDHDIIDGFGSYVDAFMKCAVFRGIGGVAHKYYSLFQHHVPPPPSTFTTDAPHTMDGYDGGVDPVQLKDTYVMHEKIEDPSYIMGPRPGPYVEERSRSIYAQLGAHIAFLGIDARTERTRHQINYPETYDILFRHAAEQIEQAAGQIKHFILLLGVPIAYPRLQWLENIFTSPVIGVVRLLNKRFGVAGGLFNNFDGSIDLMDDLDDHYTAHQHKKERKDLILRLQALALKYSVRVTILGGDVHLAAFGRFYTRPDQELPMPTEQDHRYMVNVISSAITNHPPPQAVANLLARRNKIHHLDHDTDETLLNLWDIDPGLKDTGAAANGRITHEDPHAHEELSDTGKRAAAKREIHRKTANNNRCTMPSRNYALISASQPPGAVPAPTAADTSATRPFSRGPTQHHNLSRKAGNPRDAQHEGEVGCGTAHAAASAGAPSRLGGPYGLDVSYQVEIDHGDRDGRTEGYGVTIPGLEVDRARAEREHLRDRLRREREQVRKEAAEQLHKLEGRNGK